LPNDTFADWQAVFLYLECCMATEFVTRLLYVGIQEYENQFFVVSALMLFSVLIITQLLAWDILKYET
jgi:hypothetical protein